MVNMAKILTIFLTIIVLICNSSHCFRANDRKKTIEIDTTSLSLDIYFGNDSITLQRDDSITVRISFYNRTDSLLSILIGNHTLELLNDKYVFGGQRIVLDEKKTTEILSISPKGKKTIILNLFADDLFSLGLEEYYVTYCSVSVNTKIRYFASSKKYKICMLESSD